MTETSGADPFVAQLAGLCRRHPTRARWALGFLCWEEVDDFCERSGLTDTREVLRFNQGQIFAAAT